MMDKFIAGSSLMDEIVKIRYYGGSDEKLKHKEVYPVVGENGDCLVLESFVDGEPCHTIVDKELCAPHSVEMKGKATPFKQVINEALAGSNWKMEGGIDTNNTDIMNVSGPLHQEEADVTLNLGGLKIKGMDKGFAFIPKGTEVIPNGEKGVEEDLINEPNHYHKGGIDIYGIMGAKFNEEKEKGFCIGNVLKYVIRHEMKGTPLQDLQKARFNLDRLIEIVEKELKE